MGFKALFKLNLAAINLAGYFKTIQYFFFEHYKFSVVKKNRELVERKKSEVCYICALGPSLKNVDLSKIKGDTMVVNRFYKMQEAYPDFIPTYYLMYDAAFGSEHKQELMQALESYSNKGTIFIFNSRFAKLTLERKGFYYLSAFKGEFRGQDYRIDRVMPSFDNVVGAAIGTAMGMGYKKVVLLGCDFNSFAAPVSSHCYSEKDNQRKIELWYELFRYSIVAYGHCSLQDYAKKHKIEIVNSTKGSLIDAYPFEIEEELYGQNKKNN